LIKPDVLGHVVRELRARRLAGARGSGLIRYLKGLALDEHQIGLYMESAFTLDITVAFSIGCGRKLSAGQTDDEAERLLGAEIDAQRPSWEARPFPELMRIRDLISFMETAVERQVRILVAGANRDGAKYIGRAGFQPWPHDRPVSAVPRGRNAGLVQAVGGEGGMAALGLTADQDGIVRDSAGNGFYEGYRLHGVHDARARRNFWSAKLGPQLRADLNRRCGADLVQVGPHDVWEHRNNPRIAAALHGPQLPLIVFEPDQRIEHVFTIPALKLKYGGDLWAKSFPS
jgi:hypothetical protein